MTEASRARAGACAPRCASASTLRPVVRGCVEGYRARLSRQARFDARRCRLSRCRCEGSPDSGRADARQAGRERGRTFAAGERRSASHSSASDGAAARSRTRAGAARGDPRLGCSTRWSRCASERSGGAPHLGMGLYVARLIAEFHGGSIARGRTCPGERRRFRSALAARRIISRLQAYDPENERTTCWSIGGGINGAGIARDAAGRGLSVLLVEKGDLAGATSSSSSKLIHGGLRYLEHYEFRLVAEALAEREVLLRVAAHLGLAGALRDAARARAAAALDDPRWACSSTTTSRGARACRGSKAVRLDAPPYASGLKPRAEARLRLFRLPRRRRAPGRRERHATRASTARVC